VITGVLGRRRVREIHELAPNIVVVRRVDGSQRRSGGQQPLHSPGAWINRLGEGRQVRPQICDAVQIPV